METIVTKLKEFWSVVVDVWQNGLFGIDIGRFIVAVLIFAAFLLVRRLFTNLIMHRLRSLTERTRVRFDDDVLNALEKPVRFIPIVLGVFFATEYLPLTDGIEAVAGKLVRSLIVLVIFWAVANTVRPLSFLIRQLEEIFSPSMVDWLVRAIRRGISYLQKGRDKAGYCSL